MLIGDKFILKVGIRVSLLKYMGRELGRIGFFKGKLGNCVWKEGNIS